MSSLVLVPVMNETQCENRNGTNSIETPWPSLILSLLSTRTKTQFYKLSSNLVPEKVLIQPPK